MIQDGIHKDRSSSRLKIVVVVVITVVTVTVVNVVDWVRAREGISWDGTRGEDPLLFPFPSSLKAAPAEASAEASAEAAPAEASAEASAEAAAKALTEASADASSVEASAKGSADVSCSLAEIVMLMLSACINTHRVREL